MRKQALIYVRVSSEEQVDGFSLDGQQEACLKWAKSNNFEVPPEAIFREEGVSAKTIDNRPKLVKALSYARNGKNNISAFIAWSISRVSRDTLNYGTIKAMLSSKGVALVSVSEPIRDDPVGRFTETVLAANAQLDNELKGVNTKMGMKRRFQAGLINYRPPIGYIKAKGGPVLRDPELFVPLQRLWHRVDKERLTIRQCVKILNNSEIKPPTAKKWTQQTVSGMFNNKFYMGVSVYKKTDEEVRGRWEAMVDEEHFYRVRAVFSRRKVKPKQPKYKKLREDIPLRGFIECPYCGKKLTAAPSKGKNKKYVYYFCSDSEHRNKTNYPASTPQNESKIGLEDAFLEKLKEIKYKPNHIQWLTEIIEEQYNVRFGSINKSKTQLKREINQLKKSITEAGVKLAKGVLDDTTYHNVIDELKIEIAVKEGLVAEKKLDEIDIKTLLNWCRFYLANIDRAWLDASVEGKHKIMCSIWPDGLSWDGKEFSNTQLGLAYKAKQLPKRELSAMVTLTYDNSNTLLEEFISLFRSLSPTINPSFA